MATQRVKLIYPDALITRPVIGEIARDFSVLASIRRAAVDEDNGWIICELDGEATAIERAKEWMESIGVEVERLGDVVES